MNYNFELQDVTPENFSSYLKWRMDNSWLYLIYYSGPMNTFMFENVDTVTTEKIAYWFNNGKAKFLLISEKEDQV